MLYPLAAQDVDQEAVPAAESKTLEPAEVALQDPVRKRPCLKERRNHLTFAAKETIMLHYRVEWQLIDTAAPGAQGGG